MKGKNKISKRLKIRMNDKFRRMVGFMMTQIAKQTKYVKMSFRERIKLFGQKAIDAMIIEYAQLEEKSIFAPLTLKP